MEYISIGKVASLERDICHVLDSIVDNGCQQRLSQELIESYFCCTGCLLDAFYPGPLRSRGCVKRTRLGGYTRMLSAATLA
jgi:hypothetical protein